MAIEGVQNIRKQKKYRYILLVRLHPYVLILFVYKYWIIPSNNV
jgi:hypothetical protein